MNFGSIARAFGAAAVLWGGASLGAAAQTLSDGTFTTNPGPWTFGSTATGITDNVSTSGGLGNGGYVVYTGASDGSGTYGTMKQTITSAFSGTYQVTFYYGNTSGALVSIGGTSASTINYATASSGTVDGSAMHLVTATFTNLTAAANSTLEIETSHQNGDIVSDVALVKTPGPVPGAGLLSYLMLGLAVLGLGGRKMLANWRS